MSELILTLNAGSSSIKFALFALDPGGPALVANGQAEGLGAEPRFRARSSGRDWREWPLQDAGHVEALRSIVDWIEDEFPRAVVAEVGHRVVHGGVAFGAPVIVDDNILDALEALAPLAPLHQPHNVAGLRAARDGFPGVPQVACFDTAFHRGHDFVNDSYGLPRHYFERGLRRYGFHGLSYEYVSHRLRELDPVIASGRVVVAHLGNGASLCALHNGCSKASTMGFSALEGLPMGTRCGRIDPGILLYLLEHDKLSLEQLTDLLYRESGLLGLSGLSQDMRTLEASDRQEARDAIHYFTHQIRVEIAGLTAVLGGLDALVFTGGIGEHSARVRRDVVSKLALLGLELDEEENARNGSRISTGESRAPIYVVATDEELMIARHAIVAAGLLRAAA